ncbi:hypothetical protein SCHPADRAFT_948117 [Schizopora paradoxa]|uniref:Uncharacterized protein n=1 Tax=Schizopora paradoxa TaxID=27342 RepID=A0A0H2QYF4_9AGAM|nr:hypothetical protein SCHPADRAFT_948117 [Schizopora paradoxa]
MSAPPGMLPIPLIPPIPPKMSAPAPPPGITRTFPPTTQAQRPPAYTQSSRLAPPGPDLWTSEYTSELGLRAYDVAAIVSGTGLCINTRRYLGLSSDREVEYARILYQAAKEFATTYEFMESLARGPRPFLPLSDDESRDRILNVINSSDPLHSARTTRPHFSSAEVDGDPTHPGSFVGAVYSGVSIPPDVEPTRRRQQRTALAAAVSGRHREHSFSLDAIHSTVNTPLPSRAPSPSGASEGSDEFLEDHPSSSSIEARQSPPPPSASLLSVTRPSNAGGSPGMARVSSNSLLADFLRSQSRKR